MTNQEYEQKKRECWEEYKRENLDGEVQWQLVSRYDVFCDAFDRAFALGKQFGNSEQVDAEGEEMLTVSRKRVREMYAANERIKADFPDKETAHISDHINHALKHLFGSKCLPDNVESSEPNVDSLPQNPTENCDNKSHISADCNKPAEPKFKLGDKVKHIAHPHDDGVYIVDDIKKSPDGFIYHIQGLIGISNVKESALASYTEPTGFGKEVNFPTKKQSRNLSQNCDKQLGIILKGSFLKERRLNIATRVLCGMMADPISSNIQGKPTPVIVEWAYEIADALIAQAEKGAER